MGSLVGKVVHSCITMAISDFYALNALYKTRIVLHTRDSEGEPLHALSAALDLLENIKVQAIIGPETSLEGKLLALLSNKTKVPIISFSRSPYSTEYPYVVQITPDEATEFRGIAAIIESFKWRDIILVYEDNDYMRELVNLCPDMRITYMSSFYPSATNDQIIEELHKLMTMQTTVYIVHMSPPLASRFFLNVKRLGMMADGYAWIITDKTMNLLHSMDSSSIESMQGALGFKSYFPTSSKLHNFTLRWRRKFRIEGPSFEVAELNVHGIWAYDTIWALARAVERAGVKILPSRKQGMELNLTDLPNIGASQSGSILLTGVLQSRFVGLSGNFHLTNGRLISQAFEIVNVIGRSDRRVAFWPSIKETNGMSLSANSGLGAIIWPGGSTTAPKGWLMRMGGNKLRVGVPVISGFKELVKVDRDPQTNATTFTGYCIDVFIAALEALNFEVQYEFIPFADANGKSAGSYSDLIDQVYLGNYDAVVGDVTIMANRSLYVDFTSTFTDLGVGMVTRNGNKKSMWVFLKPLDTDLWLTIAGFFILTGFVVWFIEHPINEAFQGSKSQQIGTALWFSCSTLVFAQREKLLSNLSRFVVIVWVFVVLILTSSYTATLTSLLTVQQIQLASKEDYIGYQVGSLVINNLHFADPWLRPYNSTKEYADGLSSGSVVAIIDEIPYLKIFLAKYPGNYAMVASKSTGTTNGFGFVFQKGSPLVPEISRAIMKLREDGRLLMFEEFWFKSPSSLMSTTKDSATNPTTLNLDRFRGLFLINGISLALVFAIRSIYFLHEKWHELICSFRNLVWGSIGSLDEVPQ
ncbi:glutamate receptor 1.2-like isoform X2 [Actinidia eriantha]|nr:glutamate receptor 1.2-like isoform X2 [Actinidia eriantha]